MGLLTMGILHQGLAYQLDLPVPVGTDAMDGTLNPDSPELSSSFVKNAKGALIRDVGSREKGSVNGSHTDLILKASWKCGQCPQSNSKRIQNLFHCPVHANNTDVIDGNHVQHCS